MLPLVYSLYLSICGTENKLLRVCLVLLTAFWPNNLRSLPKHYLTWWKDLSSSRMWCSLYRNHKMCRSAKLMKWVGRQPEGADSRAWATGFRENVYRTSDVQGRSGRLIKDTTDLEQVAAVSSRQRVTVLERSHETTNLVIQRRMGTTLSLKCKTWFILIKTIQA